jgi:tripartite-type tricarboxylate transporter receptor subunit TctC
MAKDVMEYWNKSLTAAVAKPDLQKRFVENGMETLTGPSDALAAVIVKDRAKWSDVIKAAGMRAD